MSLEQVLKDLPRRGTLVKDRPYRQVWRFEHDNKAYYLKFYPAGGWRDWIRRRLRGSPAMREFLRLQWLQKASVPAPRAVAVLLGFQIEGRKGDATILEAIEPSVDLETWFNKLELRGESIPGRLDLVRQVLDLLEKLGRAGLGHGDLHLGNLLLKEGRIYLIDAYAVRKGGLRMHDLQLLAHSASAYVTRTDLQRAWRRLGHGGRIPTTNSRERKLFGELLERAFRNERYAGHLHAGPWHGQFFRRAKHPRRWSAASRLEVSEADWAAAFPRVLQQIESDQFEVLKRTRSGDVLAGEIILAGKPVPVVVKRPRPKYWYRYVIDLFRGTRPRRAWAKSWELVVRAIPTAWPLLVIEKRRMGYPVEAMLVCERIAGKMLSEVDPAAEGRTAYHRLLHRCGRLLRQLEQTGLFLYDAKAENWMIRDDDRLGPTPMLIDVDGIRRFRQRGGLPRLLRSLRENRVIHFTEADAMALVRGYAPAASTEEARRLAGIVPGPATPSAPTAAHGEDRA